MKKLLCFILSIIIVLSFAGCGNNQKSQNTTSTNEFYTKAMDILDELKDSKQVKDFCAAYELLTTLPKDKDKCIAQLKEVQKIYNTYNVELHYGKKYTSSPSTSWITQEMIDGYRTEGYTLSDAEDLLQAVVYPVLFEKYGNEAQSIKGLTSADAINAIKATGECKQSKVENEFDHCTEKWEYISQPTSNYEVKYHSNGLVESINIPISRSYIPLNDDEYNDFLEKSYDEQKEYASERFIGLAQQIGEIPLGYPVLSHIFNDEEIRIIINYVRSLTSEEIWRRNLLSYGGEEVNIYSVASVSFDYKGNDMSVHYGLNDIYIRIIGNNYVNELSSKWHTLLCGLTLEIDDEEQLEFYSPYLENNTSINNEVQEWSYDLDANADKYKNGSSIVPPSNNTNPAPNTKTLNISVNERISINGHIERNTTEFPIYRFKLDEPISITFKEYGNDEIFYCEYLYFYDDTDLNGNYPFGDMADSDRKYVVSATLEDYRGGSNIFMLNPIISNAD